MPNKILSAVILFATISLVLLLNIDITGNVINFSRECYNSQQSDIQWVISLKQEGKITEQQAEERYSAIQAKCTKTAIQKKFYGYPPSEEICKRFRYNFKQQIEMEFNEFFQQPGVCGNYVPDVERCARSSTEYCRSMQQMLCIPDFKIFCLK